MSGDKKSSDHDGNPGGDTSPKDVKKAPRAPGISFNTVLKGYTNLPIPDYLLIDKSEWLGDKDIPVDRYISREIYEQEKEHIWKKVWQMACRLEEIPEVGDSYVYDITDISILVMRVGPDEVKAYYNACPHQGRLLRDAPCHNKEIRCPYHGFTWNLDGTFKTFPSKWDFPQIKEKEWNFPEVKVGLWGGFVFINMDPKSESLEDFLGNLGMHWEKYPLEDRYIAEHVGKVYRVNWKLAQETFMEAYHNQTTHPQFALHFGGAHSDGNQYDQLGNYSRGIGLGPPDIMLGYVPTREEQLSGYSGHGFNPAARKIGETFLASSSPTLLEHDLQIRRDCLREVIGDQIDDLTDFEVYGGGFFTVFPNFHPWWAFDEITYRFRPYGDDPEMSLMEIYLLRPFKGERPKPKPMRLLGPDQSILEASDELGWIARIVDQDEYNMPSVQKGMHTLRHLGKGLTFGTYQATKIRHFHLLYDVWMDKK